MNKHLKRPSDFAKETLEMMYPEEIGMNDLDQALGAMVRQHIVDTHGVLDENTIMAFTGCNEETAKTLHLMWVSERLKGLAA